MAQAVSRRRLIARALVQFQAIPCGICGGRCATGICYFPTTLVFPCLYHFTSSAYS
jgi:hypothetical protein